MCPETAPRQIDSRLDAGDPSREAIHFIDVSYRDRYNDPGYPIMKLLPTGAHALLQEGDALYMSGRGASPQGERPFVDRVSITLPQAQVMVTGT